MESNPVRGQALFAKQMGFKPVVTPSGDAARTSPLLSALRTWCKWINTLACVRVAFPKEIARDCGFKSCRSRCFQFSTADKYKRPPVAQLVERLCVGKACLKGLEQEVIRSIRIWGACTQTWVLDGMQLNWQSAWLLTRWLEVRFLSSQPFTAEWTTWKVAVALNHGDIGSNPISASTPLWCNWQHLRL